MLLVDSSRSAPSKQAVVVVTVAVAAPGAVYRSTVCVRLVLRPAEAALTAPVPQLVAVPPKPYSRTWPGTAARTSRPAASYRYSCRRCGAPVRVTVLLSTVPDCDRTTASDVL
jgi:hypothetical protein